MKRIIVLTLPLILVACTPQVTVTSTPLPTQTSIPTPTLKPEFVELQNLIADSGEALTLLPNGQIEENGIVIPNLQVDSNGEITILVGSESIIVSSTDITFEDGFHIKGYELENGEWVEAVTFEPMELSTDLSNIRACTAEDFDTGRLDWSVKQALKNSEIAFSPDAYNAGFETPRMESHRIFLSPNSKDALILANICKVPNNYREIGNTDAYFVNVAIRNTDGTDGVLTYYLYSRSELETFVKKLETNSIGMYKEVNREQRDLWKTGPAKSLSLLYEAQGLGVTPELVGILQRTGVVPPEFAKLLLIPAWR